MHKSETRTIGVLIERTRSYGRQLCEGVAAYAATHHDWRLAFLGSDDLKSPRALGRFDGFICRFLDQNVPNRFRATRRPVVDVYHDRPLDGIAAVDSDHYGIGKTAAEHFLERRFATFGFCGHNGSGYSDERRRGFVETLQAAGHGCLVYKTPGKVRYRFNLANVFSDPAQGEGDQSELGEWLVHLPKPIAIFCSHDFRAYQLSQACAARGIAIPSEVAVLGVDNDALICSFVPSPISSVDPNAFAVGEAAAQRLDRMMNGEKDDLSPLYVPCRGVIERASTEIYPLKPAWLSDALFFIQDNLASPRLSAKQVCERVGLSHTVMARHFHEQLGTTVHQEIQNSRLKLAHRLIVHERLSPSEVAVRTGFSSLQYFSNVFTARFGFRPSSGRQMP